MGSPLLGLGGILMKRSPSLTFAMVISGLAAAWVAVAPATGDAPERLLSDMAKTTVEGNTFIAPAGWTITTRGPATILEAPEGDSHIVFVDVRAPNADAAVAAAWQAYKPDAKWPLKVVNDCARPGRLDRSAHIHLSDVTQREALRRSLTSTRQRRVDGRDLRHDGCGG